MEKGLLEKTGKPLTEWIEIVRQQQLEKHGAILKYLKSEHGMTHGFANFVSLKARAADAGSSNPDDLVAAQYAKKPQLKPIYDRLIDIVKGFGEDVEVAPKKASVSIRSKRQFALIKPSTKTRIDLGLKYDDMPKSGRLKGSGSFGAMCTHSVALSSIEEVDNELITWLQEAYQQASSSK